MPKPISSSNSWKLLQPKPLEATIPTGFPFPLAAIPRQRVMTASAFQELIPFFADRILHIGPSPSGSCRDYYAQKGRVWHMMEFPGSAEKLAGKEFDCIVIDAEKKRMVAQSDLGPLLRHLNTYGRISFIGPGNTEAGQILNQYDGMLFNLGLLRFKTVDLQRATGEPESLGVVAVRREYNPAAHARELALQGLYEQAIGVMDDIPPELIGTNETLSYVAAEKQKLYLDWQKSLPGGHPLHKFFFQARREFAQVTSALPHYHAAYCHAAGFWQHLGNIPMARRTLRSILHARPDANTYRHLAALPGAVAAAPMFENTPLWSAAGRPPRILVLTHAHSDYGMDTLFDALVRMIGAENVVEYPWKPVLHGQKTDAAQNYPCAFDHPSSPVALADLLEELRDHRFDVILYADVVQMTRKGEVQQILEAGRDVPLVAYDTWDNCYTPVDVISNYLAGKPIDVLFKREMLAGVDYGSNVFPLPFGFPDPMLPESSAERRDIDVFWAGKRVWGLRPLYLPRIERLLGLQFQERYSQAEYSRRLRSARIGLSFFGSGFDTVRYWEVPAHGVMLLAEKPPIHIPHNFVDGESAVFFGDLPELEEKLQYHLSRSDEAEQIAAAGRRHLLTHHTTSARARQFLGRLEQHLTW
jgi:hypothetical protein